MEGIIKKEVLEKDLNKCEQLIMKIVWDAKEDITLQDVMRT